jgi:hypothetical protein
MNDKATALRELLNRAEDPLNEFAEMERGGKAVSALVKAEQDLAAFEALVAAKAASTDEERIRAELRRRLSAYVEADLSGASAETLDALTLETPQP